MLRSRHDQQPQSSYYRKAGGHIKNLKTCDFNPVPPYHSLRKFCLLSKSEKIYTRDLNERIVNWITNTAKLPNFCKTLKIYIFRLVCKVRSVYSEQVETDLCAACHAFTFYTRALGKLNRLCILVWDKWVKHDWRKWKITKHRWNFHPNFKPCSGIFVENGDPKGRHVLDQSNMEVPSPLGQASTRRHTDQENTQEAIRLVYLCLTTGDKNLWILDMKGLVCLRWTRNLGYR